MSRTSRLLTALGVNLLLTAGLVAAGRAARSTGLAADAGHNLTDAAAIGLALVAEILSRRPASDRRSFGYHRASVLAALANGIVLVLVTCSIIWIAVERLAHPQVVRGGLVLVAAVVSLLANVLVIVLLREGSGELGIRSALVHAAGDALSAAVVALSGLVALLASGPLVERLDPAASIVVAALIVVEAVRISGSSLHLLLEGAPSDVDVHEVRRLLASLPGITGVSDLHIWSLSSTKRALTARLVVAGDPRISELDGSVQDARAELDRRFGIDHCTLELEVGGSGGEPET